MKLNSLRFRMYVLFFLCSLVLLAALAWLSYKRSEEQINARVGDVALKNVTQASQSMDLLLKSYVALTNSVIGNADIQRLVGKKEPNPALRAINDRMITKSLGAIYYAWQDVIGIYIVSDTGTVYSYGRETTQLVDADYAGKDWYKQIRQTSGEMLWYGIQPRSIIDLGEVQPVISFGKRMYDILQTKPIGTVIVEMKPAMTLSILSNLHISANSREFVADPDNAVVVTDEAGRLHGKLEGEYVPDPGQATATLRQNAAEIVVSAYLKEAPWYLVGITPKTDLSLEIRETREYFLFMLIALALASGLLAWFVSNLIARPVKRVVREMKQVERGNLDTMLKMKSFDEINVLVSGFNRMVQRVQELVERVRVVSASEKNAQLESLQSQINPHFLYNTLDMIYWMNDDDRKRGLIGDVVLSLSQMFRYSSNWETAALVTLREELEQTGHYLLIIRTRLGGDLDFTADVPPECLEVSVPKMILQPIVENAVIHGLDKRKDRSGARIRIEAYSEKGTMFVCVTDNGVGMDETRVRQLTESFRGEPARNKRIGLRNVNSRLSLRFGPRYGLRIRSAPGQGTAVTFAVPDTPGTPDFPKGAGPDGHLDR